MTSAKYFVQIVAFTGEFSGRGWLFLLTLATGAIVAVILARPAVDWLSHWLPSLGAVPQPGRCQACGYPRRGIASSRCPECGEMYAAASPSERRIAYRRRWMALFAAHCVLFTIVFAGGALLDSVLYGHENLERFPGAHAPPGADFTVIALKGEVLSKTPSSGSPNRIVVTPGTVLAQDAVSIRASADRDPSLALRLDGVSLDPLQEIQLPAEPGHYWLIARVADTVSGHVVSRVLEIEVAARSE